MSDPMGAVYPSLSLYLDGRFVAAEGRHEQPILNPADNLVIGRLPHATDEDLELALRSAHRAFESWSRTPPLERSRILRKVASLARERARDIAQAITLDQGKPIAESLAEVASSAELAEWHAEESRRIYGRVIPARADEVRQFVLREPIGVCAAFSPWNFPLGQAMRKVAAALGAGCTIIIKGPEDAPSAVVALAHLFHDAGLPAGCLNVVWGVPHQVSDRLIRSPIVRKISFTGSVPIGKQLAALAGSLMKRCTMELGGHAPVIVCDDADIDAAADVIVPYKYRNAGQVCISPTRFYVQSGVYDRFVARFLQRISAIKVGPGLHADTRMGPLAQARRVSAVSEFVADAQERGARLLAGGDRLAGDGNFFAPTVFSDIPEDSRLMSEEPFGPVAGVVRFSALDEALASANRLPYGLAGYAFTTSTRNAAAITNRLAVGVLSINHVGLALAETPFGGIKDSGYGSEGGAESFDGYLNTKFVTQRH